MYLYDISSGTPDPVWISTNGQDAAIVGTMGHYEVEFASDSDLVQAINNGDVQLMLEIRVSGIDWYLDVAVDDFTLIPSRHYPAFQVNPVAAVSMSIDGLSSPSGDSPTVSEFSLADTPSGASPGFSEPSLSDYSSGGSSTFSTFSLAVYAAADSETSLVTIGNSELLAKLTASALSLAKTEELECRVPPTLKTQAFPCPLNV